MIGWKKAGDLIHRISGINTPVFGSDWNPSESMRNIARSLVRYLEMRGVLSENLRDMISYQRFSFEDKQVQHADKHNRFNGIIGQSVREIYEELARDLEECMDEPMLSEPIRAMIYGCRKFVRAAETPHGEQEFWIMIGELRAVLGLHLGRICVAYGIEFPQGIELILPTEDKNENIYYGSTTRRSPTLPEQKCKELGNFINRITGINTPIFGLNWNPPIQKREVAEALVCFLEDRRVLYVDRHREHAPHVVQSIFEIRVRLTSILEKCSNEPTLSEPVRAMRSACRKFLDTIESYHSNGDYLHTYPEFWVALGELRSVFGLHLGRICAAYGIGITWDMEKILPIEDKDSDF